MTKQERFDKTLIDVLSIFDLDGDTKYALVINKCNYRYAKKHERENFPVYKLHLLEKDIIRIMPLHDAEMAFIHDLYVYRNKKLPNLSGQHG